MSEIIGLAELQSNLNKVASNLEKVNDKAIKDVSSALLEKARSLAPVDKGDLRSSASVQFDGKVATVVFDSPYAASQHEHTEYEHPHGGQAKYLETPFRQNQDRYTNQIADDIRNALR